jgi:hypothetical protein
MQLLNFLFASENILFLYLFAGISIYIYYSSWDGFMLKQKIIYSLVLFLLTCGIWGVIEPVFAKPGGLPEDSLSS